MNGNQADQLLAALKDDTEWPAASLRLIHNHLEPLQEACSDDPELLGRVVELRRRVKYAAQALNELLSMAHPGRGKDKT
jgi:gamma-glutamyl:cysteine ligase YbdK (ATP-grasp superfamily)